MDQHILIVHSQLSVIEEVLDAIEPCPHRLLVSTEPGLTAHLCRRYTPDLLVLEWDPNRFGGLEAFQTAVNGSRPLPTILLGLPGMDAIPSVYVRNGIRGWHPLPLEKQRLRAQIERCLWVAQPARVLTKLRSDLAERASNLDTFLEISRAITANLRHDLDTLLQRIAEETSRMLNGERTSLFIYDRANNCLWSRVAEGEGGRTITLGMDEPGIVVHVARIGQPLRVDDAYREPLFNPDVDRMTGYHTRTILCFPVRNDRGELIGVIETLNKKNGLFDESDERLLSIMSFLFAATIENAQLYEAVRRQIRENETLEAQKIQAERLAIVGQMASSIIHDIRSPLAIIRGYAELSVAGSISMEKRQRFANTIAAEVSRLHEMARDLQEYSEGIQTIQLKPTPSGPIIEDIVAFLESNFNDRGIHIIHHLQYTGPLNLDASRIRRALHNMAINAADAMPNGGTLMITSAQIGDHVRIELHDTGCGIPEEIQSRLFEPFVTAGKSHGTGLGLAVVKRIVEEHHGEISVTTGSIGTTFTMRFPLPTDRSVGHRSSDSAIPVL